MHPRLLVLIDPPAAPCDCRDRPAGTVSLDLGEFAVPWGPDARSNCAVAVEDCCRVVAVAAGMSSTQGQRLKEDRSVRYKSRDPSGWPQTPAKPPRRQQLLTAGGCHATLDAHVPKPGRPVRRYRTSGSRIHAGLSLTAYGTRLTSRKSARGSARSRLRRPGSPARAVRSACASRLGLNSRRLVHSPTQGLEVGVVDRRSGCGGGPVG